MSSSPSRSVRSYNAIVVVVPGVVTNLNDTVTGTATTQFPIHGGRNNEGRMTIDGLNIGNPIGGNQPPGYVADIGNSQEITFTTSGGLGESENAGLVMNVVPKTGGNAISGSVYFSGTGEKLQADNFTQELKDAGLAAPTPFTKVYDLNGAFGGPIKKDRVWYFVNARTQGSTRTVANIYYNLNAGDPTKWMYAPDLSRQAYSDRTWENVSGRVTWQATARNKISGFWDEQQICRKCTGMTQGITDPARVTPEAIGVSSQIPMRVKQVSWSSPLTNRLLLDAGYGATYYGGGNPERPGNPTRDLIRVTEQCASGCAANGGIPGLVYRSQDFGDNYSGSYNWRGSAAYVTGAHSLKVGYQGTYLMSDRVWSTNNQNLTYRFNNGVPNQLTQSISPTADSSRAGWHALFAQEQWTFRRLTLQGALRFDRASSWFPEQQAGPSRFIPVAMIFPETAGVDAYKDITPRMGVAYDLFGNGKTALKLNVGKYLEGVGLQLNYINTSPMLRIPRSTNQFGTAGVTRTWTDANGNFQPDCDLLNPLANDSRGSGGDFCGQISNLSFGQKVLSDNFDPDLLTGWGVRASDWSLGLSVQQQLLPRMSIEVAYHRRWFSGFTLNDNLRTQASDYTPYSITAPRDPRLPDGGGYVISGLYDVIPGLAGQISNFAHRLAEVRRLVSVFQRRGRDVERADELGTHIPGRHQHRPERGRQLCGQGEPARAQRRHRRRSRRVQRQHHESLLSRRLRHPDASQRPGLVHDPEDRSATERRVPEQAGRDALGELCGAQHGHRTDPGTPPFRKRHERDDQPGQARLDVWQSAQPARFPRGEDPPIRSLADDSRGRSLQRAQLQRHPDVQQPVRPGWAVAATEYRPDGAVCPHQCAVRLLTACTGRGQGDPGGAARRRVACLPNVGVRLS